MRQTGWIRVYILAHFANVSAQQTLVQTIHFEHHKRASSTSPYVCVCVLISFCNRMNSSSFSSCAMRDEKWIKIERKRERATEWVDKPKKGNKREKTHLLRFVMSHKWLWNASHSGTMPTLARWIIGNLQQTKHAQNNFTLNYTQLKMIQYRRNLTSVY